MRGAGRGLAAVCALWLCALAVPHAEDAASPRTVRQLIATPLQFSHSMAAETLSGRLRIAYLPPLPIASPPVPAFTATYQAFTRSIEVRFGAPLAPGRRVKVELLAGVRALDGRALEPWELTFTTAEETMPPR